MINTNREQINKRISQTKHNTIERHKNMTVKTFTVKIQNNRLSNSQKEALKVIFLEQKWYKNYILNWCEQSENNKIYNFDTKLTNITKRDKDMNVIPVKIKYLSAQSRQCLLSRIISNIKTLHTLKSKNIQKCGKIKYSKEETSIEFKQYGTSHKIISLKQIRLSGIPKYLYVNGLNQFLNIPEIEFANARLIHRATGYYVQFICYIPKEQQKDKINKIIGIDFGCETTFSFSTGEKISVQVPESERLKKCQKSMARKQKGSKNWYREVSKIKKEYQKITNRKNDLANKIVAKLSQYETVVIQDEQLKNWHKNGHGKAVQHSILGRVKSKLLMNPNTVVLGKTVPTTKLCTNCGVWHDEIKVWNRTFKCECGVEMDRDIHAAQNMVWFYENNVGVERTKIKRVEIESLVNSIINNNTIN